jgi:hypothetical protein
MNKSTIAAILLVALLSVSIAFNVYQYSQNTTFANERDKANSKLDMTALLSQVQSQVNADLLKLDSSLTYACLQLSVIDMQGAKARAILANLTASNQFIVNSATADVGDVLLAVEPSQYSSIEGENISSQEQNLQMHHAMRPAMSSMIPLVEGFYGVVMVAPIFDSNGTLKGSLSIVIQPSEILRSHALLALVGTSFSMWAMQTNGTLIYDPDPAQQGKNLFTDPIYADYPDVQAFTQHVSTEQSGYGTYQYYNANLDNVSKQVTTKEGYWATVGIYGAEWRLVIVNILGT